MNQQEKLYAKRNKTMVSLCVILSSLEVASLFLTEQAHFFRVFVLIYVAFICFVMAFLSRNQKFNPRFSMYFLTISLSLFLFLINFAKLQVIHMFFFFIPILMTTLYQHKLNTLKCLYDLSFL